MALFFQSVLSLKASACAHNSVLAAKFEAFGWDISEVDGHNYEGLAIELKKIHDFKPKMIIAHTTKGKGIKFMENNPEWHHKSINTDLLKKIKLDLLNSWENNLLKQQKIF